MRVGRVLAQERTVDVISPHGGERTDVAGHAGHEAGDECGNAQAQKSGAAISRQHERKNLIITMLARLHAARRHQMKRQRCETQQSRQDDDERHGHLKERANHRGQFGGANILGRDHALHHQKVRRPVTHRENGAESEDDCDPLNTHGIVGEVGHRAPHVCIVLAGEVLVDAGHHAVPASRLHQTQNGDEECAEPD